MSDTPKCGGWDFAQENGINVHKYSPTSTSGPELDEDLLRILQDRFEVDLIILAGFIKVGLLLLTKSLKHIELQLVPGLLPAAAV